MAPRKTTAAKGNWRTITQCAGDIDLSTRQLQKYAKLPGCPRKSNGKGGWLYEWPAFNRFVRERSAEVAAEAVRPQDYDEARTRKVAAEAELAELQLAEQRGDLIRIEDAAKIADDAFDRIRARLVAVPTKEAHRLVGLTKTPKVVTVLRAVVNTVLEELGSAADALEEAA